MVRLLNRKIVFVIALFLSLVITAQEDDIHETKRYKDYKDPEQFDNFHSRRTFISEWQINQLKKGALVVRLKTNQKVIDGLLKAGNEKLALQKAIEQYAINKNTMFAYMENLKFCKVYFIYSNSSDTLLKGAHSGIFLDTNLTVDPNITMNENFYLIAERDYAYNSSIGFVPKDSARFVTESGNPIKEMAVVLKNKYGHQLKKPFPYIVQSKTTMVEFVLVGATLKHGAATGAGTAAIMYTIDRTLLQDMKKNHGKSKVEMQKDDKVTVIKINKELTYERVSSAVKKLDAHLFKFYETSPHFEMNNVDKKIIPFLY